MHDVWNAVAGGGGGGRRSMKGEKMQEGRGRPIVERKRQVQDSERGNHERKEKRQTASSKLKTDTQPSTSSNERATTAASQPAQPASKRCGWRTSSNLVDGERSDAMGGGGIHRRCMVVEIAKVQPLPDQPQKTISPRGGAAFAGTLGGPWNCLLYATDAVG